MTDIVNLFGETVPEPKPGNKRGLSPIQQMHAMHGKSKAFQCRNCKHLLRTGRNRTYLKCDKFVITAGPGTDWRAKWQACALYED